MIQIQIKLIKYVDIEVQVITVDVIIVVFRPVYQQPKLIDSCGYEANFIERSVKVAAVK